MIHNFSKRTVSDGFRKFTEICAEPRDKTVPAVPVIVSARLIRSRLQEYVPGLSWRQLPGLACFSKAATESFGDARTSSSTKLGHGRIWLSSAEIIDQDTND